MDLTPTTTGPLHRSVDNSFVVDTFTELSCYYPIMSKTAISKIFIDDTDRHPITELMISFATRMKSEMNSQETTLQLIRPYKPKNRIEKIRYSVLSALFYSYQNEHHLAKKECDTTERYFCTISKSLIQMNSELLTLFWSHTLLVISYLHCQKRIPTTLFTLESLSPLSTSLLEDYRLSSNDFKRHQRRVKIILFRKDRRPINDLTNWNNRFSWLEGTTASGYRHIEDIIRECRKEQVDTAISWMFNAMDYVDMIQKEVSASLERRLQYHYKECSYLIAITNCWVGKYGGLEVMPGYSIQSLLDRAVAFDKNCPNDVKAAKQNLQREDQARGGPWNFPELKHGGWNYFPELDQGGVIVPVEKNL